MLFLLLLIIGFNTSEDYCDLVELNHFHDYNGNWVYDQTIFYEWSEKDSVYHVRAWIIADKEEKVPFKQYSSNLYIVKWEERGIKKNIKSRLFKESWTQIDPERENKKIFPENFRKPLAGK